MDEELRFHLEQAIAAKMACWAERSGGAADGAG